MDEKLIYDAYTNDPEAEVSEGVAYYPWEDHVRYIRRQLY